MKVYLCMDPSSSLAWSVLYILKKKYIFENKKAHLKYWQNKNKDFKLNF